MKRFGKTLRIAEGGLVASLYVVLTLLSASFGLSSGAVQLRLSEALCIFAAFTPAAIPGLTLGCFLSNLLLSGGMWQDLVFGTLATLLGAWGGYALRKSPFFVPLPTVLANTAAVPLILAYAYHAEEGLGFLFLTVGVGEALSAYGMGLLLYAALKRVGKGRVFSASEEKKRFEMSLPLPVQAVTERLKSAGEEAFCVGGCVRDALLGRTPGDFDLAVSCPPQRTAAIFFDCRVIETGARHGTVTVISDGMPLELTTYRRDGAYRDNRHPDSVTFSERIEDDLSRRDFTVNAMAYNPEKGLIDLFGGREDLKKKRIRTVGNPTERFQEDGLRILRALRFASVLGFSIEKKTAEAIHCRKELLSGISKERVREEFCKLLCGRNAQAILLEYADVVTVCIPELKPSVGFGQKCRQHCYDVYEHSVRAVGYAKPDLTVRLSLLLHDMGKPFCFTEDESGGHFFGHGKISAELAQKTLEELRFDKDTVARTVALVERHDAPIPAVEKSVKRLMRIFSDEDIDRLMEIKRCDRLAHAEGYREPAESLTAVPELVKKIREEGACFRLSDLAVKGDDLLATGLLAGPEIGRTLSALLEKVIDGELPNEKEILLKSLKG